MNYVDCSNSKQSMVYYVSATIKTDPILTLFKLQSTSLHPKTKQKIQHPVTPIHTNTQIHQTQPKILYPETTTG